MPLSYFPLINLISIHQSLNLGSYNKYTRQKSRNFTAKTSCTQFPMWIFLVHNEITYYKGVRKRLHILSFLDHHNIKINVVKISQESKHLKACGNCILSCLSKRDKCSLYSFPNRGKETCRGQRKRPSCPHPLIKVLLPSLQSSF